MSIAVTGSIATDHLTTFDGSFADSLMVDQLDKISLSFLVDDLVVRRGGCGANIAFGLGMLGLRPLLVGAVGGDFAEYRAWLEHHGVDCSGVRVSQTRHTARFACTTDAAHAQIATFYTGAMAEAREIDLAALYERSGGWDLILIAPDDPEAMVRHTEACRAHGYRFVADPSQQLAWADGDVIRRLIDGAAYLFSNAYEAALIEKKTGWSRAEVLSRIGTRVVTKGAEGVEIHARGAETIAVEAVSGLEAVDPTGVGDAFRAGFMAAVEAGLSHVRAAQVGCTLAAFVVETRGTQEYDLKGGEFLRRCAETYGMQARDDVGVALPLLTA